MRIISGKYKGKKLHHPIDISTRPLRDIVKESIFNLLTHSNNIRIDLNDAYVLDLFSGTGSFGIECISRGAKFVTFVENYNGILPILKKNLDNLKSASNYLVIEKNVFNYLNLNEFKKQFDIIFLDPPYKEKELNELLLLFINEKILKQDGIIIIHRHKKQKDSLPNQINILEEKKYGISKILFCNIS